MIYKILAIIGLLLTISPSIFHFFGKLDPDKVNLLMAIGMFAWFIFAFLWYGRKRGDVES